MRRALLIGVLLAVAGVCGFLAYSAFSPRSTHPDRWAEAAATAQRAERAKGQVPAMRTRERAAELFLEVAASGPRDVRSRAAMLAGLLRIRNAGADPSQSRALLNDATVSLRQAIQLDRQNDDAAYDLELLLAQAHATGRPIGQASGSKPSRDRAGTPDAARPGTGY
jgi:hypothetical protein